ncbi:hypothetical protein L6452_43521 [Arctium lappa]|uniref:Uncharacterized protein n=1 Tax=Arctium lappa TaxID=4217 RepID=A0ACB8XDH4_ARCLA|nr:hypothetical protein L6452_43521 [Arctium lappa]
MFAERDYGKSEQEEKKYESRPQGRWKLIRYGTLSEFYDRMTTSVRLLNLRKQLPTFQNICRQVETLTKRHLAEIKFIFREAIQAEKILLHNKKTSSMELERFMLRSL